MTGGGEDWEVHAVRYATLPTTRSASFLRHAEYGVPDGPMTCDFYLWVVVGGGRIVLFDTGYTRAAGDRLGVRWLCDPPAAIDALGIAAGDVDTVVYSHLHSDHVGNVECFPAATVHIRRAEWDFWFSPMAERPLFREYADAAQLAELRRAQADGRVELLDRDVEVAPGVRTLALPGHTPGQQGLVVGGGGDGDGDGELILASDAAHYYEEIDADRPFFIVDHLPQMYASLDLLRRRRDAGARVVAGHDAADLTAFDRTPLLGGDLLRLR